jgi:hypothetical protein
MTGSDRRVRNTSPHEKAGQHILAESLVPVIGPKPVHFAYLVIDAVIDVPWQRERLPDAEDDFVISPTSRGSLSVLAEVRLYREHGEPHGLQRTARCHSRPVGYASSVARSWDDFVTSDRIADSRAE